MTIEEKNILKKIIQKTINLYLKEKKINKIEELESKDKKILFFRLTDITCSYHFELHHAHFFDDLLPNKVKKDISKNFIKSWKTKINE